LLCCLSQFQSCLEYSLLLSLCRLKSGSVTVNLLPDEDEVWLGYVGCCSIGSCELGIKVVESSYLLASVLAYLLCQLLDSSKELIVLVPVPSLDAVSKL
jgi:hypothetical protein